MAKNKKTKAKRRRYFSPVETKPKTNPFDLKVNHKKFDIIGKRTKGEIGKPLLSKSKSLHKRHKVLTAELKQLTKKNKFRDRRIGHNDRSLSADEKLYLRLQAERNKIETHDLDTNERLSHMGEAITGMTKFDNSVFDAESDDDDNEVLKALLSNDNSGLTAFSRKERIQHVIRQSKLLKAEKSKEREIIEDHVESVDTQWETLKDYLKASNICAPMEHNENKKFDDYDALMRSLKFDSKGNNKTIAYNDRADFQGSELDLKGMQEEALKRMQPVPKPRVHVSADDLDFEIEEKDDANEDNRNCNVNSDSLKPLKNFNLALSYLKLVNSEKDAVPVPSSYEEFCLLIEKSYSDKLARLFISSNPSYGGNNKDNILRLFDYLWTRFSLEVTLKHPDRSLCDCICIYIKAIVMVYPVETSSTISARIQSDCIKLLDESEITNEAIAQVLILRLVAKIFSVTDYIHHIGSAALLFLSHLIRKNPAKSCHECLLTLLSCHTALDYVRPGIRYMPEIIIGIKRLLRAQSDNGSGISPLLVNEHVSTIKKLEIPEDVYLEEFSPATKCAVVHGTIKLLFQTVQTYASLPSFQCIFAGFEITLKDLPINFYPTELKALIDTVLLELEKCSKQPLMALRAPQHKPRLGTLLTPAIDARFMQRPQNGKLPARKNYLKRKYNKELRSTMREIKKDSQFIASVSMKRQHELDEERKRKLKKLMSDLAEQEGDFRKYKKK